MKGTVLFLAFLFLFWGGCSFDEELGGDYYLFPNVSHQYTFPEHIWLERYISQGGVYDLYYDTIADTYVSVRRGVIFW